MPEKTKRPRKFRLKIDEIIINQVSKEEVSKAYEKIKATKNKSKTLKILQPKDISEAVRKKIAELKKKYLVNVNQKCYKVTLSLGPHNYVQVFSRWPCKTDLAWMKDNLSSAIRKNRDERSHTIIDNKNHLGFRYSTVGGVFSQPGQIAEMLKQANPMDRIKHNKMPNPKSKKHYIGLEFEFGSDLFLEDVQRELCNANLAGYTYVKYDTSIRVKKGDKQHEVTFLTPEEGLERHVRRTCKVIRDSCNGYVNDSCGLHVHLDMRNRDYKKCYWNLVQCLPIISQIVPKSRLDNEYCLNNTQPDLDEEAPSSKYYAINPHTYRSIKTVEVRIHSGSLNPRKITNFTNILLAIINMEDKLPDKVTDFQEFQQLTGISDDLLNFMHKRKFKFSDRRFDVEQDFS